MLIDVKAAPVNYVDLIVITGRYQFLPTLPFVPGKGPAGIVRAVGANVTGLKVGDRVLAMAEQGGYAEQVAVAANQCYRLPPAMSFVEAAAMSLAYDTSWFALRDRARVRPGETVLVLGASGAVGLAAIQLAKAMGARVLAGIARPEKAAVVMEAGADAMVDLSGDNLRDSAAGTGAGGQCGELCRHHPRPAGRRHLRCGASGHSPGAGGSSSSASPPAVFRRSRSTT